MAPDRSNNPPARTTPGRVAVLDEDHTRAGATAAALADLGVERIVPPDPVAFLDQPPDDKPDLILVHAGKLAERVLERADADIQSPPVILTHGAGDIPTVVEAMRRGAFDYVARPIDTAELRARVAAGIDASRQMRERSERRSAAGARVRTIDARQRLLAEQIMLGHSNAEIARRWGVSERTIAGHRAGLMRHMDASNTAHLVRVLIEGGFAPEGGSDEPVHAAR
ncbi:MAG: response regulator transcription factor [Phycisphaerales bacterium]